MPPGAAQGCATRVLAATGLAGVPPLWATTVRPLRRGALDTAARAPLRALGACATRVLAAAAALARAAMRPGAAACAGARASVVERGRNSTAVEPAGNLPPA